MTLCRRLSTNKNSLTNRCWIGAFAVAIGLCGLQSADAQVSVSRVEEDWVVEISEPDPLGHGPQICTVISPRDNLTWAHAIFEINHSTFPDYVAGGMQLQRWVGNDNVGFENYPNPNILAVESETITFTIVMSISGSTVTYEIVDGHSTTWGDFGGQGYLKTSMSTWLSDLGQYDPEISVTNSRIGFASHRVNKLALKEVRTYAGTTLVSQDTQERVVHELSSTP